MSDDRYFSGLCFVRADKTRGEWENQTGLIYVFRVHSSPLFFAVIMKMCNTHETPFRSLSRWWHRKCERNRNSIEIKWSFNTIRNVSRSTNDWRSILVWRNLLLFLCLWMFVLFFLRRFVAVGGHKRDRQFNRFDILFFFVWFRAFASQTFVLCLHKLPFSSSLTIASFASSSTNTHVRRTTSDEFVIRRNKIRRK